MHTNIMKTIKRPTHNDEFNGEVKNLSNGDILIEPHQIIYKYKGFSIVPAGTLERLTKRFDQERIEEKTFYRVLNENQIDISPTVPFWTLPEARIFINSLPDAKKKA